MSEKKVESVVNPYDLPSVSEEQKKEPYWMGTLPTCPVYNLAVGGTAFQRYTNPPIGTDNDSGETQRAYSRGSIEMLSSGQAKAILEGLKTFVVRFHGNTGKGNIHKRTHPLFTQIANDQPLAQHVYFVRLNDQWQAVMNNVKGGYPPSVYEAAGGKPMSVPERKPEPDIAPEIEDLDKPAAMRHTPPQLAGKK